MRYRNVTQQAVVMQARRVDITVLPVDAIVNAANEQLAPGGGVFGAIHRAAGPDLALACGEVGFCPTGQARITPGFRLPARYVIHAVGPVWHGGQRGEAELLASAYRSALELADSQGLTTIAFPAISTGIYGFPLRSATEIAVGTTREFLGRALNLREVTFACFSGEALQEYQRAGISA